MVIKSFVAVWVLVLKAMTVITFVPVEQMVGNEYKSAQPAAFRLERLVLLQVGRSEQEEKHPAIVLPNR